MDNLMLIAFQVSGHLTGWEAVYVFDHKKSRCLSSTTTNSFLSPTRHVNLRKTTLIAVI
jgi:hypothetical protein